jgi:hypothetical protein
VPAHLDTGGRDLGRLGAASWSRLADVRYAEAGQAYHVGGRIGLVTAISVTSAGSRPAA